VKTISIDAVVSDSTQVAQNVMIPEDDIANLYKGLVFAISDYVRKPGFQRCDCASVGWN